MIVVVTGDRWWGRIRPHPDGFEDEASDQADLEDEIVRRVLLDVSDRAGGEQVTLRQGEAKGADQRCKMVGHGLDFDVEDFPAAWNKVGRAAGPIRNIEMLDTQPTPDEVHAFHDDLGNSKGTLHCVKEALKRNLKVVLHSSNRSDKVLDTAALEKLVAASQN